MSNNVCGINISRETFKQSSPDERDAIIFDCLKTITEDIAAIKKREKVDKKEVMWIGGVFGFLGGALITLAKFLMP